MFILNKSKFEQRLLIKHPKSAKKCVRELLQNKELFLINFFVMKLPYAFEMLFIITTNYAYLLYI